jgi:hypothetical protein
MQWIGILRKKRLCMMCKRKVNWYYPSCDDIIVCFGTCFVKLHSHICFMHRLVVPVTFGHPWLCHSSHLERAVVPTDVVRVSELVVCTLRLSVHVFTLLPDMRKPKTLVLTFWTLVPKSFGNFRKHAPLYNRWFFRCFMHRLWVRLVKGDWHHDWWAFWVQLIGLVIFGLYSIFLKGHVVLWKLFQSSKKKWY